MPVAGRVAWLRRQVLLGRRARVTVGAALDSTKAKYKVVLDPEGTGSAATVTQSAVCLALDALAGLLHSHIVVDRGHRHTDGTSEVCF